MNQNYLFKKFVNQIIRQGKKQSSFIVLKKCFKNLKKVSPCNPTFIFVTAINNVTPSLYLQKVRRGSQLTYLPRVVSYNTRCCMGIRWILSGAFSSAKKGLPLDVSLASEVLAAFNSKGYAFKKKMDYYSRAESTRLF